jgi:hypothetical protein
MKYAKGSLLLRWQSLDRVLKDKELSRSAVLVFKVILEHVNGKTGECFPSMPTIAAAAELDHRTVERAIAKLKRNGHLQIAVGGGRGRANVYRPTLKTSAGLPGLASHIARQDWRGLADETPAAMSQTPAAVAKIPGTVVAKTPAGSPGQPSCEPEREPFLEPREARSRRGAPHSYCKFSSKKTALNAALDLVAKLEEEERAV